MADEELMELVAGNDADAFEVVMERHADAVFALIHRMCGRASLAEDAAQEVYLTLWRRAASYDRARGSVRTWALGIAHNRAIDFLRRDGVHSNRRANQDGIEETLVARESTDGQAIDRIVSAEVCGALDDLPVDQREVIELAYFGGFSQTEIADIVDVPLGTVKGRMRLGLERLRGDRAVTA
ncbi:MAG: sigma-70 family RNA polymerase sigma factor [Solirubrobacterales bacterium]